MGTGQSEHVATTARVAQAQFWQQDAKLRAARTARLTPLPLAAWFAFIPLDIALGDLLYDNATFEAVSIRIAAGLVVVAASLKARRAPPRTPGQAELLIGLVMTALAAGLGGLAACSGPLATIHLAGGVIVMTVPSFLHMPWTRSARPTVISLLAFVGTFALAIIWRDRVAQFINDRATVTAAGFGILVMATMGALSVAGGHLNYNLRLKLYETQSIGKYQLKKLLGRGGMGEVWAAFHLGLRRDVALKVLRDVAKQSALRFEREVSALADLRHPNTVRVFDYGFTETGVIYYAMELLDGMTLAALVRSEGPLTPERVLRVASQASRALGEAHDKGMVHRDVKPDNLFLANAGGELDFIKVIDFGIVRLEEEPHEALTLEGFVVGTPNFMAPELATGKDADARSDVYALGAVMYYLLTGQPPFQAKGVAAQLAAHVVQEVVPPSVRTGRPVPRDLEALVLTCLSKDPALRPRNGAELARALAEVDLLRPEPRSEDQRSLEIPRLATEVMPVVSDDTHDTEEMAKEPGLESASRYGKP